MGTSLAARAGVLGVVLGAAMMVAACGGGSSSTSTTSTTAPPVTTTATAGPASAASGSPTATTAPVNSFCAELGDYGRQFKSAVADGQLASLKGSLAAVVDKGKKVLPQAPPTVRDDLTGLTSDLSQFNNFVQTKATQKDLDGGAPPPELAQPLADLSVRGTAVKTWYKQNCNGDFGS